MVSGNVNFLDQVFWSKVHCSCPYFLLSYDMLSELIWSANESMVFERQKKEWHKDD